MGKKKLYHLLTAEQELKSAAAKIMQETNKVFKGANLFQGRTKRYEPKEEGGEPLADERQELVTTVGERLAWTRKPVEALLDFEFQKEEANQRTKATLKVGEKILLENAPATFMLVLEKRLREIRDYYDKMPTLDLSEEWERIEGTKDRWIHGPVDTFRTAKRVKGVILAPATDKHPAQVKDVNEDVHVGTWRTTHFSGAAHPAEKAALLARIDELILAVKTARMEANEVDVLPAFSGIGKRVFDHIHGDVGG